MGRRGHGQARSTCSCTLPASRVLNRAAAYAGAMTVVAPASAPTREDAERAAEVLMGASVAEVLLFGSVAADISAPTPKPTALAPC